jgi:CBS domain-containing protein
MNVESIMKRSVVSVPPSAVVGYAARLMREHDLGFLPVCDEAGRAIGVVTDRDIAMRSVAEGRDPRTARVADVMTPEVIACRAEQPIVRAEALMRHRRVTRIVVVDEEGRAVGVVSLSDLAQYERPVRVARILYDITARKYGPESGP